MRIAPAITALVTAVGALCLSATTLAATHPTPARTRANPLDPAGMANVMGIRPMLIHIGRRFAAPPTTGQCEADLHIFCYGPTQLQKGYDLAPLFSSNIDGRGQTIVIVDSFGSPTIAHDLAAFDAAYGLAAPHSLRIIAPAGGIPAYRPTDTRVGWAGETTLDVEYAHAMAPAANILVVATPTSEEEGTSGFPEIVKAENYVINKHLGAVISQSFGATEQTFPSAKALLNLRSAYVNADRNHVTVVSASGDSGAADVMTDETTYYLKPVTSWPASDPLVTAVGGTRVHLTSAGNHSSPDEVWNDTYNSSVQQYIFGSNGPNPLAGGSGKSVIFGRPTYQNAVASIVGTRRAVPDISMDGACASAVVIYQSFPGQPAGWYPTCGTSASTPLFAGIVALADQAAHRHLGAINGKLYAMSVAHAAGIVDVTKGNATVSFRQGGSLHTVTGGTARSGYDLPSGVGTVDAAKFVPELAAQ